MRGYKATDKDMKCKGFQFELGKWYEHEGKLELCKSGFHFCRYPSGPWCYYSDPNTRIFEVEAEEVLESPVEPGADFKQVCKRIRLVKEILFSGTGSQNIGNQNIGNRNSGDRNSGYRNSGDRNSGDLNSGDLNSGDRNSGDFNSGDLNSGDQNIGNRNSGYRNSGDRNSGDRNSGYRNSGDRNSGYRNSGDFNATNFSCGFFCAQEPKVISFDAQTDLTHDQFIERYPETWPLGRLLWEKEEIPFEPYKNIPGITEEKLKKLHEKFLKALEAQEK